MKILKDIGFRLVAKLAIAEWFIPPPLPEKNYIQIKCIFSIIFILKTILR